LRKVSEYEQHAEECRKMASRMKDPVHRKQVEDMAQAWAMLARERERQLLKLATQAEAPARWQGAVERS
jgi:hypothetical protein